MMFCNLEDKKIDIKLITFIFENGEELNISEEYINFLYMQNIKTSYVTFSQKSLTIEKVADFIRITISNFEDSYKSEASSAKTIKDRLEYMDITSIVITGLNKNKEVKEQIYVFWKSTDNNNTNNLQKIFIKKDSKHKQPLTIVIGKSHL